MVDITNHANLPKKDGPEEVIPDKLPANRGYPAGDQSHIYQWWSGWLTTPNLVDTEIWSLPSTRRQRW